MPFEIFSLTEKIWDVGFGGILLKLIKGTCWKCAPSAEIHFSIFGS